MARIDLPTLLVFTTQFATMLRSQLPLVDILENLAKESPQATLRHTILSVAEQVKRGVDLGRAMAEHSRVFDQVYISVVNAGMKSGRLAESLAQVSEYLAGAEQSRRLARRALAYPMFLLVVFVITFNAMVYFILPRFETMFTALGKEMPGPTRFMLDVGNGWRHNWYWIVAVLGIGLVLWGSWLANREGRLLWDQFKLRLPLLGPLWRMAALSRFLRTLSVQLHNEIVLLEALDLAAAAAGNSYIEAVLRTIITDVERGQGLAASFRRYDVFAGIVLQMVAAGEESGNLDELLLSAADFFEKLLENRIKMVTGLLNPLLTLVLGLMTAAMMIACFLPVLDLSTLGRMR